MNIKDAIYGRRSIRKFKSNPLSKEDMQEIVEAGLMAPSGTNAQNWYFVVISDPDAMAELRKIAGEATTGFRPFLKERFPDHPEVVEATLGFIGSLGNAPAAVLAFIRRAEDGSGDGPMIQSIAAAMENMILMAYGKGIGSCWLTSLSRGKTAKIIRKRFAPERGNLVATAVFGYPDQDPKPPKRKEDRVEYI